MGRQVKRVSLDFQWSLGRVWEGFLNPHYEKSHRCSACEGGGWAQWARDFENLWWGRGNFRPEHIGLKSLAPNHPAIMRLAQRNVAHSPSFYGNDDGAVLREAARLAEHYNCQRQNFLTQEEIDLIASQNGFDRSFDKVLGADGTVTDRVGPLTPDFVTTTIISSVFSDVSSFYLIKAMAEKSGSSYSCAECDGEGVIWNSLKDKAAAEAWKPSEPPKGDGWQLWETVSEGSPVSPVFATAEELAEWLAGPESSESNTVNAGTSYEKWLSFIKGPGWAPSLMVTGGRVVGGVEAMQSA